MTTTSIAWATSVWNTLVGCSRIAAGCGANDAGGCYAERSVHRGLQPEHKGLTRSTPSGPRWTGEVRLMPERLVEPARRRKPERYFCDSLSDLGHDKVPESHFRAVVGVALLVPRHRFIVLTKRAARVRRMMEAADPTSCVAEALIACPALASRVDQSVAAMTRIGRAWPPPNLAIGASVANQKDAAALLDDLVRTPAACRIVSYEPALGPVDFTRWLTDWTLAYVEQDVSVDLRQVPAVLDGILVGGEAGPRARPMHPSWARDVRGACEHAGVAFFMKQEGAWTERRPKLLHTVTRSRWSHKSIALFEDGTAYKADEPETWGKRGMATLFKHGGKNEDPTEWTMDLRVRELPKALELESR